MKVRKSLSVLLVVAIISSYSVPTFALSHSKGITKEDSNVSEKIIDASELKEKKEGIICDGEFVDICIPESAEDNISISNGISEPIEIKVPDILSNSMAIVTDDGTICYTSNNNNITFNVQLLQTEIGKELVQYVKTSLRTDENSFSDNMKFEFDLPEDYKIIDEEAYYACYSKNTQDIKKIVSNNNYALYYIIDSEGTIINSIEFSGVKDANGDTINVDYYVLGETIIQDVNITNTNEFPITTVMSSYAPIWKYNEIEMLRSNANAEKAKEARREINARQNNTLATFCNLMTSLFDFLPVLNDALSYTLTLIDSVYGGISDNLERQEDMYTLIYEVFTSTASLEKSIAKVNIVYPLYGTYQGKNKGYRYQQRDEYAEFYNYSGQQVDSNQFS